MSAPVDVLAVLKRIAKEVEVALLDGAGIQEGDSVPPGLAEKIVALWKVTDEASAAIAELMGAARPLVARSFDEARDNEDRRIAARKSGAYPPPEMLWCRADVLNPCWMPGTPYTGKHWSWTPDAEGDGEVCEHCRLRAALRACGGALL